MTGAEAEKWGSRPAVVPVVVSIRDTEVTSILGPVIVAMPYQASFPVVVEVGASAVRHFFGSVPVSSAYKEMVTKSEPWEVSTSPS